MSTMYKLSGLHNQQERDPKYVSELKAAKSDIYWTIELSA
jgi:hypothetical protein